MHFFVAFFSFPPEPLHQVGALKKSELPDLNALAKPGRADGQHIVINNNGKVEAYTWNQRDNEWQFAGTENKRVRCFSCPAGVLTGLSSSLCMAGPVTGAVEPDYTFHIEVGDQKLKLEYNKGENPYMVRPNDVAQ